MSLSLVRIRLRIAAVTAIAVAAVAASTSDAAAACGPDWQAMPVDSYAMPQVMDIGITGDAGWIVGVRATGDRDPEPRMLAWTGTSWGRVVLPTLGTDAWLEGVDATSADEAWAVGYYVPDGRRRLLTMRWDGAAWTRVDALPRVSGRLRGVVALAPDDAWAVGQIGSGTPLAIHWDGSSWTRADLPTLSGRRQIFEAVDASATDELWAVGQWREPGGTHPLLVRRTAQGWTESPAPPGLGTYNTNLFGVASVRSSRAWAVGHESNGAAALLLRWNGETWRRVATGDAITSLVDVSFRGRRGWATGHSADGPVTLRSETGAWVNVPPADPTFRAWTVEAARGGRTVVAGVAGSVPRVFERCD